MALCVCHIPFLFTRKRGHSEKLIKGHSEKLKQRLPSFSTRGHVAQIELPTAHGTLVFTVYEAHNGTLSYEALEVESKRSKVESS